MKTFFLRSVLFSLLLAPSFTKMGTVHAAVEIQCVYTEDTQGNNARLFQAGSDVKVVVVVRNLDPTQSVEVSSTDITIVVRDLFTADSTTILIPTCENPGTYSLASLGSQAFYYLAPAALLPIAYDSTGFHLVGKLFDAKVSLSGSQNQMRWRFFVDEFGPSWVTSTNGFDISKLKAYPLFNPANSQHLDSLFARLDSVGLRTLFISAEYYNWGQREGAYDYGGRILYYWFPTGYRFPYDYHYTTPPDTLARFSTTYHEMRQQIRDFVSRAHGRDLKVLGYLDPMGIYSPTPAVQREDSSRAHRNATSQGWARFNAGQQPMRLNFAEDQVQGQTPSSGFGNEVSFGGRSPSGPSNYDEGFSSTAVDQDLAAVTDWDNPRWENWRLDPSQHYHMAKQVRWLVGNDPSRNLGYDLDGFLWDDTGRLNQRTRNVPYFFYSIYPDECLFGVLPSQGRYGLDASDPGSGHDQDQYAINSLANFVKHVRWQIKGGHPDKVLLTSDYYVPRTPMPGNEDASSTDLYCAQDESFARRAYHTYTRSLKGSRTDYSGFTPGFPQPLWIPQSMTAAISWANGCFFWFTCDSAYIATHWNIPDDLRNYAKMYDSTAYHPLLTDPCLDLLAHPLLDEEGLANTGEVYSLSLLDPYYVLYRIPGAQGEARRILHIINNVPGGVIHEFPFTVKVPIGQSVERICAITPDGGVHETELVHSSSPPPNVSYWYYSDNLGNPDENGGYVYLYVKDVQIYDLVDVQMHVPDPTQVHIVGSCDTPGDGWGVCVSGAYAYVADGRAGLQVIGVSDPTTPTMIGSCGVPTHADFLAVSGPYAYVADGYTGLRVINVTDPRAPTVTGTCYVSGYVEGVYVSGSYAYVPNWSAGLQVINISNPASPTRVGSCDTPGYAQGVYVSGSYACVADATTGLQIINVANPASPIMIGSCETPGYAEGVYVSGTYAYVADGYSGLQVIDISVPTSPEVVGFCDTPGYARGIYASGSYAYVVDQERGLQVIDISNPSAPVLVGSCDTPGSAWGVFVSGSNAYVADAASGLQVMGW